MSRGTGFGKDNTAAQKERYGTCRLCQTVDLLCYSHIVPEFCYEYDDKHRTVEIHAFSKARAKEQLQQKGLREYLFCETCEGIFGRHEDRFIKFWRKAINARIPISPKTQVILEGADYPSMKLFLLSVFWRASISQSLSGNADFGPYSERLRSILHANQYVPPEHYPVLGQLILSDNGYPWQGCVTQLSALRFDSVHSYSMCFAGCQWSLVLSDHYLPKKLMPLRRTLTREGSIILGSNNYRAYGAMRFVARSLQS